MGTTYCCTFMSTRYARRLVKNASTHKIDTENPGRADRDPCACIRFFQYSIFSHNHKSFSLHPAKNPASAYPHIVPMPSTRTIRASTLAALRWIQGNIASHLLRRDNVVLTWRNHNQTTYRSTGCRAKMLSFRNVRGPLV